MYPRKLKPEVPIDERIKQLREEGLEKEEITRRLYEEKRAYRRRCSSQHKGRNQRRGLPARAEGHD